MKPLSAGEGRRLHKHDGAHGGCGLWEGEAEDGDPEGAAGAVGGVVQPEAAGGAEPAVADPDQSDVAAAEPAGRAFLRAAVGRVWKEVTIEMSLKIPC